jgi:hypothetical protein
LKTIYQEENKVSKLNVNQIVNDTTKFHEKNRVAFFLLDKFRRRGNGGDYRELMKKNKGDYKELLASVKKVAVIAEKYSGYEVKLFTSGFKSIIEQVKSSEFANDPEFSSLIAPQ